MASERLQKILARAGVASRRAAEALIEAGRVRVDGKVVNELGAKADPERQKVTLDGNLIAAEPTVYVLFHKPRRVVSTMSDPEGRETVADYVKQAAARVVPVGRLDYHTSGVLLLTNDGDFSSTLMHPSSHIEKVYVAKVRGVVRDEELEGWRVPIEIDGRATQPAQVRRLRVEGDKTWLEITLREGRNRQIHRLGEAAGSAIFRLARISFAGITSEGLRPGDWRYLSRDELSALKKAFGVPKKIVPAPPLPNADEIRKLRARGIGRGERGTVEGKLQRDGRSSRDGKPQREGAISAARPLRGGKPQRGKFQSDEIAGQGKRPFQGTSRRPRKTDAVGEAELVAAPRGKRTGPPRRTRAGTSAAEVPLVATPGRAAAVRPFRPRGTEKVAEKPNTGSTDRRSGQGPKFGAAKPAAPKLGTAKFGGSKGSGPKRSDPKRSDPKRSDPKRSGPKRGGPKSSGPKS